MNKKKILLAIGTVLTCTTLLAGCSGGRGEETQFQRQVLNQSNDSVGMPNIKNFFEKKVLKEVYELRDQSDLVCYAYSQNMNGKFIYLGQCIGYGIPYSTQYTCPQEYCGNGSTLPQADPNALYSPEGGVDATWLILINEAGEREIVYSEQQIMVTQSKLPKRLLESWSIPNNY